tara:strand:- start:137 stop:373 length:237 start_codon:yes stop_codon:yes gene_type:complete
MKDSDISRIIEMAWEDRTPFDAINKSFKLNEQEVKSLMRKELSNSSYKMWRKRVSGRKTKHIAKRGFEFGRHKSPNKR